MFEKIATYFLLRLPTRPTERSSNESWPVYVIKSILKQIESI